MESVVVVYEVMRMTVTFDGAKGEWIDSPAVSYPDSVFIVEQNAYRLAGELNLNDMLKARYEVERNGYGVYDLVSFNFYFVLPRPAVGRELAWLLRMVFVELVGRNKEQ